MIHLKSLITGIKNIVGFIKTLFDILMSVFETLAMVFRYLLTIVDLAFDTILTFPSWIKAFAVITISISIAYFLIGRNIGKSE